MLNCSYFQTFLLCALPVLPQTSALDREFTISADVELVILDVSVKDPKGGFVSGLVKDNFRVYENKKEQSIKYFSHADIPVTVGLVIDNSGSMRPKRAEVMRQVLESRATIYTIGIFDEDDPDRNPDILQKLAQVSGGEYFQLRTLDEVVPVCRKIAADIRNRYTVAYIPSRPDAPQSARLLMVTASSPSHPRLIVHTRKQLYPVEADRTKAPY